MKVIITSILLCLSFLITAQVGINTRTPQEMLDVNGTIRSRDLAQGAIQADADGNIINGAPNSEFETPFSLGTNNNPSFISADALTYTTFDGNYSTEVTLPSAAESNSAGRIGSFILIRKRSSLAFNIKATHTDLPSDYMLGTNFGDQNPTAIFMFDGYRWIFIKESQ